MVKILDEVECLDWYDGPLISIMNGDDGKLYYCHWGDLVGNNGIWMATPVTKEEIEDIKTCKIDLHSILTRPETKFFSDKDYILTDSYFIPDYIPEPGVMLYHNDTIPEGTN